MPADSTDIYKENHDTLKLDMNDHHYQKWEKDAQEPYKNHGNEDDSDDSLYYKEKYIMRNFYSKKDHMTDDETNNDDSSSSYSLKNGITTKLEKQQPQKENNPHSYYEDYYESKGDKSERKQYHDTLIESQDHESNIENHTQKKKVSNQSIQEKEILPLRSTSSLSTHSTLSQVHLEDDRKAYTPQEEEEVVVEEEEEEEEENLAIDTFDDDGGRQEKEEKVSDASPDEILINVSTVETNPKKKKKKAFHPHQHQHLTVKNKIFLDDATLNDTSCVSSETEEDQGEDSPTDDELVGPADDIKYEEHELAADETSMVCIQEDFDEPVVLDNHTTYVGVPKDEHDDQEQDQDDSIWKYIILSLCFIPCCLIIIAPCIIGGILLAVFWNQL